jgi:hypothetical protein
LHISYSLFQWAETEFFGECIETRPDRGLVSALSLIQNQNVGCIIGEASSTVSMAIQAVCSGRNNSHNWIELSRRNVGLLLYFETTLTSFFIS